MTVDLKSIIIDFKSTILYREDFMAKRAMTEEAKLMKANAILDQAAQLLLETDYEKIKMTELAKSLGLSNGILYVYFKTKETLFLRLLWREYEKRLDYLISLTQHTRIRDFDDVSRLLLEELEYLVDQNPLYIKLEAMRSVIFEKKADIHVVGELKKLLFEKLSQWSADIEAKGILTKDELLDIFFKESAMIIGCSHISTACQNMEENVRSLGLHEFRRDFKKDVMDCMACYLRGLKAEHDQTNGDNMQNVKESKYASG